MDKAKAELLGLSNYARERLAKRIEDMTDEEYLWEPAPDCWSVRPNGEGKFASDWGLVFDEVPPVTTIAWRLWHIILLLSEERCATWIGVEPEPENFFDRGAPGTAQAAGEMLVEADARWQRYVTATPDDQLFEKIGPEAQFYADQTRFAFVLHIIDELIHHSAEIGVLRDLHRAERRHDPVVSKLLRGDTVADAAVAEVRTKRPHLVLEAAATAHWDAIPQLIELGFDVSGKDGRTPLHHAAADGRIETMRVLLDAGSDIGARDPIYKATPVEWAEYFKRTAAADLLRETRA